MAVIKHSNANRLIKDAVVLDLGDIQRQADAILDRARAQSEQILTQARSEAQQLIDSASEIGHEKGLKNGLAEGKELGQREGRQEVIDALTPQLEKLISNWEKALEQWEHDRDEMLLAAREDVLAFAFAMGEKLTHRIIEQDPTVVQDQLAQALSLLMRPSALNVLINPADREHVEEVLDQLVSVCSTCQHVELRDSADVSTGGCIVRTSGGEIDATIDTQLARIAETLLPWTTQDDSD